MDNTSSNQPFAIGYTMMSILSGLFASITANVELWIRIGAGGIAIISGFMAIRYYYYATKEKQQSLKQQK